MDGVIPLTPSPHTGTATDINGMEMTLENIAQLKKAAGERHQEATHQPENNSTGCAGNLQAPKSIHTFANSKVFHLREFFMYSTAPFVSKGKKASAKSCLN